MLYNVQVHLESNIDGRAHTQIVDEQILATVLSERTNYYRCRVLAMRARRNELYVWQSCAHVLNLFLSYFSSFNYFSFAWPATASAAAAAVAAVRLHLIDLHT